jgi:precorrin-6B methylase 2
MRRASIAGIVLIVAMMANGEPGRTVAWASPDDPPVSIEMTGMERPRPRPPVFVPPKGRRPDVIYVPTPQEVVDAMLKLARVKKHDVVYDLGCGDGRIVVTAAKKYGAYGFGFEIDPERIKDSQENARKAAVTHLATFHHADVFTLDLKEADVVTLYLLPSLNVKLIPQLEKLRPGTRIVSHAFDMRGVKPKQVVKVNCKDGTERTIYLWVTPLVKE